MVSDGSWNLHVELFHVRRNMNCSGKKMDLCHAFQNLIRSLTNEVVFLSGNQFTYSNIPQSSMRSWSIFRDIGQATNLDQNAELKCHAHCILIVPWNLLYWTVYSRWRIEVPGVRLEPWRGDHYQMSLHVYARSVRHLFITCTVSALCEINNYFIVSE